jgi:hypothetical protein
MIGVNVLGRQTSKGEGTNGHRALDTRHPTDDFTVSVPKRHPYEISS